MPFEPPIKQETADYISPQEKDAGRQPDLPAISLQDQLAKMRSDWDQRAFENAKHYVNTAREHWTEDDFLPRVK